MEPTGVGESTATFTIDYSEDVYDSAGTFTVTANYQPEANSDFVYSSGTTTQTVNLNSTTTTLSQSTATSYPGQPVDFHAVVTANNSPVGGSVQFYDAGSPYGSPVTLTTYFGAPASYADLTTSSLTGTQTFVVRYLGDVHYDGSVSDQVSHSVVNPPAALITLSSAQNPAVAGHAPITLDVAVTANPGPTTPTGGVTVFVDGNPVEGGSLDSTGNYQVDISGDVGLGHNSITADYGGDAIYPVQLSSTTLDQVVTPGAVAADDAYTTAPNTDLTVADPGVLGNDTNLPAGDEAVLKSPPSHGTFVTPISFALNGSGGFVYRPAAGYTGTDTFTYCVAADYFSPCDTNLATATITVTAPVTAATFTNPTNGQTGVATTAPFTWTEHPPLERTPALRW